LHYLFHFSVFFDDALFQRNKQLSTESIESHLFVFSSGLRQPKILPETREVV